MNFFKNKIILGLVWITLSISLGFWWMVLGLNQSKQIYELKIELKQENEAKEFLFRQSRMIKLEGSFFILLLIIGGSTLLILTHRENSRILVLKNFFATLTHEMKTPLASLRLQAETLEEEIKSKKTRKTILRLIDDTKRLELQMDKALYLASLNRKESLFIEKIDLNDFFHYIKQNYEILNLNTKEKIFIKADKKALESIFKNLIENSIHHGSSTKIEISYTLKEKFVEISFKDNGNSFQGEASKLGKLYYKHGTKSGSGIGIYLIINLISKMNGLVSFFPENNGFKTIILIPGE